MVGGTTHHPRPAARCDTAHRRWRCDVASAGSGLSNDYLRSVFFLNSKDGWAVGDGVVSTADGGKTWQSHPDVKSHPLYCVAFQDPKQGWLSGAAGALFVTTDGGRTWKRQPYGTPRDISIVFTDYLGVAVGATAPAAKPDATAILRSPNLGRTWSP